MKKYLIVEAWKEVTKNWLKVVQRKFLPPMAVKKLQIKNMKVIKDIVELLMILSSK